MKIQGDFGIIDFFSSQTLCKIFMHNVLGAIVNNFFADLRNHNKSAS